MRNKDLIEEYKNVIKIFRNRILELEKDNRQLNREKHFLQEELNKYKENEFKEKWDGKFNEK